jgi:YfiR/HmsC-like
MTAHPPSRQRGLGITGVALIALLVTHPALAAGSGPVAPDVAVKAALLFNFGKFVQWPSLSAGAPLVICVVGDDDIAAAVLTTVRGQNINGHGLEVRQPQESTGWRSCHLLFLAAAETRRSADGLGGIRTAPILTVSDAQGFAHGGGIIELFIADGKMRFAINIDATARAGLRLSSRLLLLAKVVRDGQAQGLTPASSWAAQATAPLPGAPQPLRQRPEHILIELQFAPSTARFFRALPRRVQPGRSVEHKGRGIVV